MADMNGMYLGIWVDKLLSGPQWEYHEAIISVPYTENYNETLDSLTVVLKHVSEKLDLKPYDEVIVGRGLDDRWGLKSSVLMLVDSVNCTRKRYTEGDTYYEYTLELMSETKWLEKIQLPNRSFTHELGGAYRDAYDTMKELVDLYVPKIVRNGALEPIVTLGDDVRMRFIGLQMKDTQMSKPTLRQALTAIMSQFGCIPVVRNQVISFIDFNESQGTFTDEDVRAMNSEVWTNSSDSYVNTLRSNLGQLTGGVAKEYAIGFRDRGSGLLHETSNLKLNTSMPIYKIRKCSMHSPLLYKETPARLANYASQEWFYSTSTTYTYNKADGTQEFNNPVEITKTTDTITISVYFNKRLDNDQIEQVITKFNGVVYNLKKSSVTVDSNKFVSFTKVSISELSSVTTDVWNTNKLKLTATYPRDKNGPQVMFCMNFSIDGETAQIVWNEYIAKYGDISDLHAVSEQDIYDYMYTGLDEIDITPLIKTTEERKLLSYDYAEDGFDKPTSVEQMARYYYNTFQYDVGGTTIEGFSDTYDVSVAWWSKTHIAIDNIFNCYVKLVYVSAVADAVGKAYPSWAMSLCLITYKMDVGTAGMIDWMSFEMLFNIEYEPLADIDIVTTKDEFEVPLVQYDGSGNSVTDFGSFMAVEDDKIDRLGNPVHIIGRRYSFEDNHDVMKDLIPLGARNESTGEVVYKRVTTFKKNYADVAYYLCKDYVITNYSTAVTTKYRAYQYVDYSKAIQRNENRISYLVISNASNYLVTTNAHTVMGTSATFSGGLCFRDTTAMDVFLPFVNDSDVSLSIGYKRVDSKAKDASGNVYIEGDTFLEGVSVMTYPKGIAMAFKDWDTVSPGLMVEDESKDTGRPQHAYMPTNESNARNLRTTDLGLLDPQGTSWQNKENAFWTPYLNADTLRADEKPSMSVDLDGIVQDQSELLCLTQQIEYRSWSSGCKIYEGIEKLARICNDSELNITFVLEFDSDSTSWASGKVSDHFVANGSDAFSVDDDITIFVDGKKAISFESGTYYVGLNGINKQYLSL